MAFDELMKAVGQELKLDLQVTDGVVRLSIDNMEVSILELSELEMVVLQADIAEPPPQGLESLYLAALEANHNFSGTSGATLSFNPETKSLALTRPVLLPYLDAAKFLTVLESFANVLESWKKIIANYRPDEKSAPAPAPESEIPQFGGGFMQV